MGRSEEAIYGIGIRIPIYKICEELTDDNWEFYYNYFFNSYDYKISLNDNGEHNDNYFYEKYMNYEKCNSVDDFAKLLYNIKMYDPDIFYNNSICNLLYKICDIARWGYNREGKNTSSNIFNINEITKTYYDIHEILINSNIINSSIEIVHINQLESS